MRNLTLAVGIIVVGVLAALPFRRTRSKLDFNEPDGYSAGLHGRQIQGGIVDEVVQWPDRPGSDPSLAWQPLPMKLEAPPRVFELPPMSDEFPEIELEAPSPLRLKSRFDAVPSLQETAVDPALLAPPVSQIKDRFTYPALPESPPPSRQSSIHAASVITHQEVVVSSSTSNERQYIREPE